MSKKVVATGPDGLPVESFSDRLNRACQYSNTPVQRRGAALERSRTQKKRGLLERLAQAEVSAQNSAEIKAYHDSRDARNHK